MQLFYHLQSILQFAKFMSTYYPRLDFYLFSKIVTLSGGNFNNAKHRILVDIFYK